MAEAQSIPKFLADTSAWNWSVATEASWRELLSSGQIATCPIVEIEYLFSARSSSEFEAWRQDRLLLESVPLTESVGIRAAEVQSLMSKKQELGHRSARLPDLIIAACAEEAGFTLLHYDQDFDRICEATGQPGQWLAPRGTLER